MVDFKVWSVMQEQVYQTAIHDVNDLKQYSLDVSLRLLVRGLSIISYI